MTSDISVGRGVQDSPQDGTSGWDVIEQDKVGRSKWPKNVGRH